MVAAFADETIARPKAAPLIQVKIRFILTLLQLKKTVIGP